MHGCMYIYACLTATPASRASRPAAENCVSQYGVTAAGGKTAFYHNPRVMCITAAELLCVCCKEGGNAMSNGAVANG